MESTEKRLIMHLTQAEVNCLKMWSRKGRFALSETKRLNATKPTTQIGLSISKGNYSGRAAWAFDSLRELGLLRSHGIFEYHTITVAGERECDKRWPELLTEETEIQ